MPLKPVTRKQRLRVLPLAVIASAASFSAASSLARRPLRLRSNATPGQIVLDQIQTVLILRDHGVSCTVITKVGKALLTLKHGGPVVLSGLACHHVNVNAGGGAEMCRKRSAYVEYGFE